MSKFSSIQKAILLFILITLILPFYDSKRVIMWETQGAFQEENVFHSLILIYAKESEKLKKEVGLDVFFEKESSFWKAFKEPPLVFQPTVRESTEEIKIEETQKEIVKKEEEKKDLTLRQAQSKEKEIPVQKIEEKIKLPPKYYASYRFLIIGDSFIAVRGGMGEILEGELLNYKDVTVKRVGVVSSGLSRPDYFNWEVKTIELIFRYKPNIAVVMLSSNDAQSITTSKGDLITYFGSPNWNEEYAKRVSSLLDIFEKNNITTFWIGFPIMKNKAYSERIKNLNSIYEKECQKRKNAYFFSTRELLADEKGNYLSSLPDEKGISRALRQSDGIHLTYFGGKMVVNEFLNVLNGLTGMEAK